MGESNDALKLDEENGPVDALDIRSVWLVAAKESDPRQSVMKILIKHRSIVKLPYYVANNVQGREN